MAKMPAWVGPQPDLSLRRDEPASESEGVHFSLQLVTAFVLIFLHLGRPFDYFLSGFHIPLVLCSLAILVVIFTRSLFILKSRVGIALVLFLAWMCMAAVFSIWRVASAGYVQQYVEFDVTMLCLVAAAPRSFKDIRALIVVALLSVLFNVAIGSTFDENGRLILRGSTLGNSGDVAIFGGLCIPLVLLFASGFNVVMRSLIAIPGVLLCLAMVVLSSARFGLIGLAILGLLYFLRAGAVQRLAMVVASLLLVAGTIAVLPKANRDRLSTIIDVFDPSSVSEEVEERNGEAIESLQERRQVLFDAIDAAVTHPVFGVGPNEFLDWRHTILHKHALVAHNTFAQIAAEEGFPALLCYLGFIVGTFVTLHKSGKLCSEGAFPGWEQGGQLVRAVRASLIYFVTCAFFISCDHHMHQFVLAGLALALELVIRRKIEAATSETGGAEQKQAEAPITPLERIMASKPRPVAETPTPRRYRFGRSAPLPVRTRR